MRISEAESVVMTALWERGEATAEELVAELSAPQQWQEPTIKTLLNRLLNKGAIAAERDGRRYRYRPLLARQDWVLGESTSLVDRLFAGRIAPLVAHFSEHGRLTRTDIDELRRLVAELDDVDATGDPASDSVDAGPQP
jgi:BlaI family transcriptional regulator, penicillinase repressor